MFLDISSWAGWNNTWLGFCKFRLWLHRPGQFSKNTPFLKKQKQTMSARLAFAAFVLLCFVGCQASFFTSNPGVITAATTLKHNINKIFDALQKEQVPKSQPFEPFPLQWQLDKGLYKSYIHLNFVGEGIISTTDFFFEFAVPHSAQKVGDCLPKSLHNNLSLECSLTSCLNLFFLLILLQIGLAIRLTLCWGSTLLYQTATCLWHALWLRPSWRPVASIW